MEESAKRKALLKLLENGVSRTTQQHSELEETSDNTLGVMKRQNTRARSI